MRKASIPLMSQKSEPLIVVEDSEESRDEYCGDVYQSPSPPVASSDEDSPTNFMNPYLLSPWRDARETRKNSLPTPQCSDITASQVRRLSERGDCSGPGPKQTEFLATLSTAPTPTPGGRRHSVVTISKLPTTLFGRSRRESVATFSSPGRVLSSRRESFVGPPSTEPRGSVHNLQLDIMDDIVQARKVRMKMWSTSSEKVCEVQELDVVQKYTGTSARRFSEFVGTTLAPIPSSGSRRRASEMPPLPAPAVPSSSSSSASKQLATGIVCSNTDLITILSSLTASASATAEITEQCEPNNRKSSMEEKRSQLKTNRSNSFDVSILDDTDKKLPLQQQQEIPPIEWFAKRRHIPTSSEIKIPDASPTDTFTLGTEEKTAKEHKVVWDGRSGSIVDVHMLGNAIEDYIRKAPSEASPGASSTSFSTSKFKTPTKNICQWFAGKNADVPATTRRTCESNICSSLKDLFVK